MPMFPKQLRHAVCQQGATRIKAFDDHSTLFVPMVIISPHLDDAVFSCGHLLAMHPGSTVVTVFAGFPAEDAELPEWDAHCGFQSPQEAVMARREEDRRGLGLLEARPVWLNFLDSQYGTHVHSQDVSRALMHTLSDLGAKELVVPMGLFHADHILVHDAAMAAVSDMQTVPSVSLYEDVPYRSHKGLLQQRLCSLATQGMVSTPRCVESTPSSVKLKTAALAFYASQLKALGPRSHADLHRPERLWQTELPVSKSSWRLRAPVGEVAYGY